MQLISVLLSVLIVLHLTFAPLAAFAQAHTVTYTPKPNGLPGTGTVTAKDIPVNKVGNLLKNAHAFIDVLNPGTPQASSEITVTGTRPNGSPGTLKGVVIKVTNRTETDKPSSDLVAWVCFNGPEFKGMGGNDYCEISTTDGGVVEGHVKEQGPNKIVMDDNTEVEVHRIKIIRGGGFFWLSLGIPAAAITATTAVTGSLTGFNFQGGNIVVAHGGTTGTGTSQTSQTTPKTTTGNGGNFFTHHPWLTAMGGLAIIAGIAIPLALIPVMTHNNKENPQDAATRQAYLFYIAALNGRSVQDVEKAVQVIP